MSASALVLPQLQHLSFNPTNLLSYLEQFAHNSRRFDWEKRLSSGDVVDKNGLALAVDAPYVVGQKIHYWRDAGPESPVPFEEQIIYQDEHVVVADKPHFLPVTPSGGYVQETLLLRLRNRTGLFDLTPMHRIDRDTAGLVLFSVKWEERDHFARIFRERQIEKSYECIAPYRTDLIFPILRKSRLVPSPDHFMQMVEVPGEPNSETYIELIQRRGTFARYRLQPVTGKRHQLRVHMNALGIPIHGDGIYPVLTPENQPPDYSNPLLLLAQRVSFTAFLYTLKYQFQSQRTLEWPVTDRQNTH